MASGRADGRPPHGSLPAGRRAAWRERRWYRYRVPGLGDVDWRRVVDTLYQAGFDGVLSVEHEDPVWSGDTSRILSGLMIAHSTLRPLIRRAADDAAPLVDARPLDKE